ncbi:unnamed protein product [Calypogeia fissa]
MLSTESNGHKDGSQQEEPQTMGGPVESGDTSIVGDMKEEQLLDKMLYLRGDSNGGNIQGLPEWAIKRTAVSGLCSKVHVYHVSEILGEPCETEEMEPRWFTESEIPYETMWSDDILWYPEFLKSL